jgi:hypothetical protein
MGIEGSVFCTKEAKDTWKKLVLLPDSLKCQLPTSTYSPPAFSITRPNALLFSPTIQDKGMYFCRMHKQAERNAKLCSGRSSTTSSTTSKSTTADCMLVIVRLEYHYDRLTIEEQTLQMVHPPCPLRHHVVDNLLHGHLSLHHHVLHVHRKACARARPHHPSFHAEEREIVVA